MRNVLMFILCEKKITSLIWKVLENSISIIYLRPPNKDVLINIYFIKRKL